MTSTALRWHVFPDMRALTAALKSRVLQTAESSIAERGVFRFVLSGGSTPRALYQALARADADWPRWQLFFTDERCLSKGHADRNDVMARDAWLDPIQIDDGQIHAIAAELGPERASAEYAETLAGIGLFDLTLLGLGEDGHTASLFPGDPVGADSDADDALAIRDAPKSPPERVSMSAGRLSRSRAVALLVSGEGKRDAVRRLNDGAPIPAAAVQPDNGIDVFLDSDAAIPGLPQSPVSLGA